jgi:hypothetical protein
MNGLAAADQLSHRPEAKVEAKGSTATTTRV